MENNKTKNKYATRADISGLGVVLRNETKGMKQEIRDEMKDMRKNLNDDFKTHINVLYEKFHGDVKLVIERQGGMDRRLERVEKKVDLLTETAADIKVEVTGNRLELDNKTDRAEHKGLERRVIALKAKV